MKHYAFLASAFLATTPLTADIGLVYSDGRMAALYEENGKVIYRQCRTTELGNLTRKCAKESDRNYVYEKSQFLKSLKALTKISNAYHEHEGIEKVVKEITFYQGRLDSNPTSETRHKIEKKLEELNKAQADLVYIHREILEKLSLGNDRTVDHELDLVDFRRVAYGLNPIWFDGTRRWYVASTSANIETAVKLCSGPWRRIDADDLFRIVDGVPAREAILKSPLATKLTPGYSVWIYLAPIINSGHTGYLGHINHSNPRQHSNGSSTVVCIWD